MELDKAIQNRHSVRKFKEKKPDWRDIIEAIDSARFAPMAGNNFSLKFILVDDSEKIKKITEASQQPFIEKAHYVVVVCSDPKRTINAYGERGKKYVKQQAGAAIQNFLLKLQETGLSTTWIGHFVDRLIKQALTIPEGIEVEAVFPIGIEFEKKHTKKIKIDLDNILYFNKYKNTKMNPEKKLDV